MLAYPGDPALYHAQFTVRLIPQQQQQAPGDTGAGEAGARGGGANIIGGIGGGVCMNPMLLKAAARGSHAARKHLLLASLPLVGQVRE